MTTQPTTQTVRGVTETPTQRPATPSDPPCSCGRPALVVFLTERFGEVPSCSL